MGGIGFEARAQVGGVADLKEEQDQPEHERILRENRGKNRAGTRRHG
jgi:hypothetical protein